MLKIANYAILLISASFPVIAMLGIVSPSVSSSISFSKYGIPLALFSAILNFEHQAPILVTARLENSLPNVLFGFV